MNINSFESVVPTALYTAYPLIFTDIPYAKEIFEELDCIGIPNNLLNSKLAVELEARYKLIDKLLDRTKISSIYELAAGFTARGLNRCKSDKNLIYLELDLPQVIDKKEKLLSKSTKLPDNLHLLSGNVLKNKDFFQCEKYFNNSKPIAVINQGLMRYLDFKEKRQLAVNIYSLLKKNGGVWITCDVTPMDFIINQEKNIKDYNKRLSAVTDRNNANWRFKNKEEVNRFFWEIGFDIEWHDFYEVKNELVSPKNLNYSDKEVDLLLAHAVVVVMTIKKAGV